MKTIYITLMLMTTQIYAHEEMRAIIHALPKAELHIHIGGSYPLEYLKTVATDEQYAALERGIERFVDGVAYEECFFVFELISRIVNTDQKVEDGTYALCKALQADNVTYVELRTGLKDCGSGFEGYLNAVLAGMERASRDGYTTKLLLSVKRTSKPAFVQATIDLALAYKDRGIVGIDISDNSVAGDITPLVPLLKEAKQKGLAVVAHIGESAQEHDQMLLLTELQPDRIGHGVHLQPEARAWIVEHQTPLEICLASSVCAKMVDAYAQHPGLQLYQEGHPVCFCTDDPLIVRTTLTNEYVRCARVLNLAASDIQKVIEKSFAYHVGAVN